MDGNDKILPLWRIKDNEIRLSKPLTINSIFPRGGGVLILVLHVGGSMPGLEDEDYHTSTIAGCGKRVPLLLMRHFCCFAIPLAA